MFILKSSDDTFLGSAIIRLSIIFVGIVKNGFLLNNVL